jgi:teichuronic acid biosynthesis glycosyltransferase TuaC
MKVLVLAHEYPHALNPTVGCFVHEQVKALPKHCEVVVVSPTSSWSPILRRLKAAWAYYAAKPGKTEFEGIEVYRPRLLHIPTKWVYPLQGFLMDLTLRSLFERLKETFGFDLIHAHTIGLDGFAAARLGRRIGTPVVCTIHGSDINLYPHRTKLSRMVTQQAIRSVDALITVSAALKERTLALETPKREIRVIPNGVDLQQFAPQDKSLARSELGLPQHKRIIVYASRLVKEKGVSFLLAAFKTVLERESDCLLVLVGDGHYRQTLVREAAEAGLQDDVVFAGYRPHAEVVQWMNAGDLVVLPSLTEGAPLPVYEALACGKPLIASRVGGIPEVITSDDYGLLMPPADSEALAEALLYGLHKEWNPRQIREHSTRYSWANIASQVADLYGELLSGRAKVRSSQG